MASTTDGANSAHAATGKRRRWLLQPRAAQRARSAFDPRAVSGDANGNAAHELELFESRQAREQCNHFAPIASRAAV